MIQKLIFMAIVGLVSSFDLVEFLRPDLSFVGTVTYVHSYSVIPGGNNNTIFPLEAIYKTPPKLYRRHSNFNEFLLKFETAEQHAVEQRIKKCKFFYTKFLNTTVCGRQEEVETYRYQINDTATQPLYLHACIVFYGLRGVEPTSSPFKIVISKEKLLDWSMFSPAISLKIDGKSLDFCFCKDLQKALYDIAIGQRGVSEKSFFIICLIILLIIPIIFYNIATSLKLLNRKPKKLRNNQVGFQTENVQSIRIYDLNT
jgi:hypothetical protein